MRDIRTLSNESAKVQRFAALLESLFPGANVISQYFRGVEKLIRINTRGKNTARLCGCLLWERDYRIREFARCDAGRCRESIADVCRWVVAEKRRECAYIAGNCFGWRHVENLPAIMQAELHRVTSRRCGFGFFAGNSAFGFHPGGILALAELGSFSTSTGSGHGGLVSERFWFFIAPVQGCA